MEIKNRAVNCEGDLGTDKNGVKHNRVVLIATEVAEISKKEATAKAG